MLARGLAHNMSIGEGPPKVHAWPPLGIDREYIFHNKKLFPLNFCIPYFIVMDLKSTYALLNMNSIVY